MRPAIALIFHAVPPSGAGPLVRALAEARRALAEEQLEAFLNAGADDARLIEGEPDWLPFGRRLAAAVRYVEPRGAIVLGSGSIPLASAADYRQLVDVAAGPPGHALANNRFSSDVVAVSSAACLAELPDLPSDNALPRWLEERADVAVADMRDRWRLSVDLDSPADLALLSVARSLPASLEAQARTVELLAPDVAPRVERLVRTLRDRRGELVIAGRVSTATLAALEADASCRVRAFVEERGLRASSVLAQAGTTTDPSRRPRSLLGELLDRDGPEAIGAILAGFGDAAVVDTRVLLAHRLGGDESAWPDAEDRFASDLLAPDMVADEWLRAVTASVVVLPILLGGHSLLNGDLRMLSLVAAKRARTAAGEFGPAPTHDRRRPHSLMDSPVTPSEPADTPA